MFWNAFPFLIPFSMGGIQSLVLARLIWGFGIKTQIAKGWAGFAHSPVRSQPTPSSPYISDEPSWLLGRSMAEPSSHFPGSFGISILHQARCLSGNLSSALPPNSRDVFWVAADGSSARLWSRRSLPGRGEKGAVLQNCWERKKGNWRGQEAENSTEFP